ncbi:hypothetical protein BUE80_DR000229, partial [Diplocarpon rosae]
MGKKIESLERLTACADLRSLVLFCASSWPVRTLGSDIYERGFLVSALARNDGHFMSHSYLPLHNHSHSRRILPVTSVAYREPVFPSKMPWLVNRSVLTDNTLVIHRCVALMLLSNYIEKWRETSPYTEKCLGLHQAVVLKDCESFGNGVNEAFRAINLGRLLSIHFFAFVQRLQNAELPRKQGLKWNSLIARLCDAKNLRGLPMIRQLDQCRVEYPGFIYIARADDTISWTELRDVAPNKPRLEAFGTYDPLLDGSCDSKALHAPEMSRPAAGNILTAYCSLTQKRRASGTSREPPASVQQIRKMPEQKCVTTVQKAQLRQSKHKRR